MTSTLSLFRNRMWDRTALDLEKLVQLVWSMQQGGWKKDSVVTFEVVVGVNQIVFGHKRTLAVVLANTTCKDVEDIDDVRTAIMELAVSRTPIVVCPVCSAQVSDKYTKCPMCKGKLHDDNDKFLGVADETVEYDPEYFVRNYDEIIHSVDIDVPAVERPYANDKDSLLAILGDNSNREDTDLYGKASVLFKLVNEYGASTREITGLGIGMSEVASLLAIAQMPPEIATMIAGKKLAMSVPKRIFEVKDSNQRQALVELVMAGAVTLDTLNEWISRMKNLVLQPGKTTDSPLEMNIANLKYAVGMDAIDANPVGFWKMVCETGIVYSEDDPNTVSMLGCGSCPLAGKLKDIPKIQSSEKYRCQFGNAKWCLMHSDYVVADSRVVGKADVEFADGTKWFSSVDLAVDAYGQLFKQEPAATPASNRPIDDQREMLRQWIAKSNDCVGHSHPIATTCDKCAYQTDESPVASDPLAPRCLLSLHRARLSQYFLVDEAGYTIPVCEHFSPKTGEVGFKGSVQESAPSKDFLKQAVIAIIGIFEQNRAQALRFLTGTPIDDRPDVSLLRKRVDTNDLNEGQLIQLLEWLVGEIGLASGEGMFRLPAGRIGRFKKCS
jgi:hypothetical protein